MENIYNKKYAQFMEDALQSMVQLPVTGICIITKLDNGAVFTQYYNSKMMDKITYSGVIQQDAMLDMLKANNMIADRPE